MRVAFTAVGEMIAQNNEIAQVLSRKKWLKKKRCRGIFTGVEGGEYLCLVPLLLRHREVLVTEGRGGLDRRHQGRDLQEQQAL